MKLTGFTDYCLRVLMFLAAQPERRATIAEIARAFSVNESHLTKVVHFLGRAGLLANVRGRGGGLSLARPPAEIGIGEVVREAEGPAIPAECFDARRNGCCAIAPMCRLQGVLREAVEAFHAVLDRYTLEDLVHNRESLIPVLFAAAPPRGNQP